VGIPLCPRPGATAIGGLAGPDEGSRFDENPKCQAQYFTPPFESQTQTRRSLATPMWLTTPVVRNAKNMNHGAAVLFDT
jgi:hypothetical protein